MSRSSSRRRAERLAKIKARKGHGHWEVSPSALVSLTPQGHAFYQQLLESASAEVGCEITGDDLLEALRRVREETGKRDPQFKDPVILACFKKHLHAVAAEE